MAQKAIEINGVSIAEIVPKAGYTVSYTKRQGSAGGMMLNGMMTEDTLAIKAVITVPIIPLRGDAQVQALIDNLYDLDYPVLYYFDPRTNTYRRVQTLFDGAEVKHAGENIEGSEVWKAAVLTFTER